MARRRPHNRKPDPSRTTIRKRAEAIRKGWSELERAKRVGGAQPVEALEVVPLGAVEKVIAGEVV